MSTWPALHQQPAPPRLQPGVRLLARLAVALVLAASFGMLLGGGLALAAAHQPGLVAGTLSFLSPSTKGLIGGPPGAKTAVRGGNWLGYSAVELRVTPFPGGCDSGVSVGTFPTSGGGGVSAQFLWPAGANQLTDYYACGIQTGKGTYYSHNTFRVLANKAPSLAVTPASALAGDNVTVTGEDWLPGPQTVSLVVLPCSALCAQPAVGSGQVVTDQNGAFSLQITISAKAASGAYYIQAANGQSTLSATSPALQVTSQSEAGGTPVPGTSPTSVATRNQGKGSGGITPTPSNTVPALKAGLVAAVLGALVLALCMGGGIFLLRTGRLGQGSTTKGSKKKPDPASAEKSPTPTTKRPGQAEWRTAARSYALPDRPALPPIPVGPGRDQDDDQAAAETEANIWEGEARTAPETDLLPFTRNWGPEQAQPAEQDAPEATDLEASQPAQNQGRQFAPQPFMPPRSRSFLRRRPFRPPAQEEQE